MPSYSLFQRTVSGVLTNRVETQRPESDLLATLTDMVDGHGIAALRHYGVRLDGRNASWRADEWWEMKLRPLVRVAEESVMARLMAEQARKTSVVDRLAGLLAQETVRRVIGILGGLGLVVAERAEVDTDA